MALLDGYIKNDNYNRLQKEIERYKKEIKRYKNALELACKEVGFYSASPPECMLKDTIVPCCTIESNRIKCWQEYFLKEEAPEN